MTVNACQLQTAEATQHLDSTSTQKTHASLCTQGMMQHSSLDLQDLVLVNQAYL